MFVDFYLNLQKGLTRMIASVFDLMNLPVAAILKLMNISFHEIKT